MVLAVLESCQDGCNEVTGNKNSRISQVMRCDQGSCSSKNHDCVQCGVVMYCAYSRKSQSDIKKF